MRGNAHGFVRQLYKSGITETFTVALHASTVSYFSMSCFYYLCSISPPPSTSTSREMRFILMHHPAIMKTRGPTSTSLTGGVDGGEGMGDRIAAVELLRLHQSGEEQKSYHTSQRRKERQEPDS